jgi:hypothetical protein
MLSQHEVTGRATYQAAIDPVLSIPQVAGVLNVSPRTVWRVIGEQKLRSLKMSQRRRGVLTSELQRYLSAMAA